MFCQFLLYRKMVQSYIYIHSFFSYYLSSCSIKSHSIMFPVLYGRTSLHIHSKCNSLAFPLSRLKKNLASTLLKLNSPSFLLMSVTRASPVQLHPWNLSLPDSHIQLAHIWANFPAVAQEPIHCLCSCATPLWPMGCDHLSGDLLGWPPTWSLPSYSPPSSLPSADMILIKWKLIHCVLASIYHR